MASYYHAPWPDPVIPEGCPRDLYYEVDEHDSVPRMVEVFPDGRAIKDSIDNDPGPWGDIPTLVHDEWSSVALGIDGLESIDIDEFEAVWRAASFRVHSRP